MTALTVTSQDACVENELEWQQSMEFSSVPAKIKSNLTWKQEYGGTMSGGRRCRRQRESGDCGGSRTVRWVR